MKTVILAEKASQAAAYAQAFQKKTKVPEGYRIEDPLFAGETVIVHASGHLLELKQPEEYDEKWKKWRLDNLPIFPDKYDYKIKYGKAKQLAAIRAQLKTADRIIIATDSDREGENIARSIIRQARAERKELKRLWINSLEAAEIRRGFCDLWEAEKTYPSYIEAQTREISDWLVGMNLSRFYTIQLKQKGLADGAYSVGRVQTPTLYMIYKRDQEIAHFKPELHYECLAEVTVKEGTFEARYKKEFQSKAEIKTFIAAHQLQPEMPARIRDFQPNSGKKEFAPRLYALSDLQRTANARFRMSAKDTLATVQELYEKKYVSYPRTDTSHITANEFSYLKQNLQEYLNVFGLKIERPNLSARRKFVDDSKVQEHYAIIPTKKAPSPEQWAKLSARQQKIYELILRRTLAMFEEDFVYDEPTITVDIQGLDFTASGRIVRNPGWKRIEQEAKKSPEQKTPPLPPVTVGEPATARLKTREKETRPPKPYTEGTLIAAMKNAGREAEEEDKEILKETNGIGTEATRAGIIENLKDRGYIAAQKNELAITEKGRTLCRLVKDNLLSDVALTAEWEKYLAKIHRSEGQQDHFLDRIKQFIQHIMETESSRFTALAESDLLPETQTPVGKCPVCGRPVFQKGSYLQCEQDGAGCSFKISRYIAGRYLTTEEANELLEKKVTKKLSGFKKRDGKRFSAALQLKPDEAGQYGLSFRPFAAKKTRAYPAAKKKKE